jgi:hypothetical protein
MPTIPLPQDPDLGQLRNQARELQRAVRAGHQNTPELLLRAGFDVNSYGRSDGPFDDPWHAALHRGGRRG